jgi:hypothetical protein
MSHKQNRELENREVSQMVVVELRSLRIGSVRTQVSEKEVTNCEVSQTNSSRISKHSRTRTKDPKPTQVSGITAGVHECSRTARPRGRACMSAAVLCGPVSNSRTHKGPQVEPDRPTKGIVQLPTTVPGTPARG